MWCATRVGRHCCRSPAVAARQIDADIARNADHESADNTRRSAVSSTAPVIRSVTPEGSSTSIMPPVGRSACGRVGTGSAGGEGAASCPTGGASVTGANPVSSAKLPPPSVKLAAADRVHPANQHDRRPRRDALRQNPQLLLDAPASPPLRACEHLSTNLASPHTSTPEVLVTDQQPVIHLITAPNCEAASRSAL